MIKINLSNDKRRKIGVLKSLDYEKFGCQQVECCYNVECSECMFNYYDEYTLEEILEWVIDNEEEY